MEIMSLDDPPWKEATNVFKELARQEQVHDIQHNTINELIQLVQKDNSVSQFIDLLYEITLEEIWGLKWAS